METVRRKKLTNFIKAQLMQWMHLMILTQIIHLYIATIANTGRKK